MARKMSTPPKDSFQVVEQGELSYLALSQGPGKDFFMVKNNSGVICTLTLRYTRVAERHKRTT